MNSSPLIEKSPTNALERNSQEMKDLRLGAEHAEDAGGVEWAELIRIAFVVLTAAAVWFRIWEPFPRISVIGIAATLIGGYPIFKEAFENIVERKMTMELSMTIALLSALAIGEFFTALVITGFVLAAEVLEGLTLGRGRRAIQDLLNFLPRTVTVRRNAQVVEIAADQVRVGDTVIVKPGGHVPVDGVVLGCSSFVEQAVRIHQHISSEFLPRLSICRHLRGYSFLLLS
jgi:cation transport ATPase